MSEDQENRDGGDDDFFTQRGGDGVDGRFDEAGALVEGDDADALGQAGLELADFFFHRLGDFERVLADAHHHHAADGFLAVFFEGAAAEFRAELDGGEVFDANGHAVSRGDDDIFKISDTAKPADAAD